MDIERRSRFEKAKASPAYAAAMDAPPPAPPRATKIGILVGAGISIALVGLGLALDERVLIVVGGTLMGFALVMFVATANERARAALPVQHELVEIVASTNELREPNPLQGNQPTRSRADFVEVHFEDGMAGKREVVDPALRKQIRAGALVLPCMGVAVCRGDELHGWHAIST